MAAVIQDVTPATGNLPERSDVLVVGAGFSGLYLVHRLRKLGFSVHALEAGSDVGGTWYWNRYPGARCDSESIYYSFSFDPDLEQEWTWSEKYSTQPEILSYLQHVADRFDLRRSITFNSRMASARFNQNDNTWTIATDGGAQVQCRFLILATGCLSMPILPDLPGFSSFKGEIYHTGKWPHHPVSFAGKRVAVIGTGSSGIQSIPVIAKEAAYVHVFQRTPNYSLPAHNRPLNEEEIRAAKSKYPEIREKSRWSVAGLPFSTTGRPSTEFSEEEHLTEFDSRWNEGGACLTYCYTDIITNRDINEKASEFVRDRIRSIVKDPTTAEKLMPRSHPIATKRICIDTGYYETFNRDNVALTDVNETPIESITPDGIRTGKGEAQFDAIVYATGFDAMTGALLRMDILGKDGLHLRDYWSEGPRTYLGLAVHGFPNMFTITGPQSPSVLSSMTTSIEQHVDFVSDYLELLRARGVDSVEASREAEENWVTHTNECAAGTLYPDAASWYMGANIPGKPRIFLPYVGGVDAYRRICDKVVTNDYEGFEQTVGAQAVKVLV